MSSNNHDQLFIVVNGIGPSDLAEHVAEPQNDEAVELASDIHDLLVEDYDKTDVTGVATVVNRESHRELAEAE